VAQCRETAGYQQEIWGAASRHSSTARESSSRSSMSPGGKTSIEKQLVQQADALKSKECEQSGKVG